MRLSDAPIGVRVVMVDNTFDDEVRWTHYERREGVAVYNSNPKKPTAFVTAYRLRMLQGVPGKTPRYDSGEIRIATEVDGRIPVILASEVMSSDESPEQVAEQLQQALVRVGASHV